MNQKTKEQWVIPTIIALVTGTGFLFLGPWLTGTPLKPSFSMAWLKFALFSSLPVWLTLFVLLGAVIMTGMFLEQRGRTIEEVDARNSAMRDVTQLQEQIATIERDRAADIERFNSKQQRLHGVWNTNQTLWSLGRKGQEPMMQIVGWMDLTSSNTDGVLYLLAAYIDGRRADIFMDVEVKPGRVNRAQIALYMVPPLETDTAKPFTATILVEDQFNRKHALPTQTFRGIPNPSPLPPPTVAEEPCPVLHTSWRGDAAWGWANTHPEEDPIYLIRGDVTMLMDNIGEPVIITGIEIEGAESIGTFDNFRLEPRQPQTRGMRLYFRGKAPAGNDYYTAQLTFKDLRGNRYPTVERRFHPLPIPERVGIERGTLSG